VQVTVQGRQTPLRRQIWLAGQPQLSVPPHPSGRLPQPAGGQACGTQGDEGGTQRPLPSLIDPLQHFLRRFLVLCPTLAHFFLCLCFFLAWVGLISPVSPSPLRRRNAVRREGLAMSVRSTAVKRSASMLGPSAGCLRNWCGRDTTGRTGADGRAFRRGFAARRLNWGDAYRRQRRRSSTQ
jgi:hypothetical protein